MNINNPIKMNMNSNSKFKNQFINYLIKKNIFRIFIIKMMALVPTSNGNKNQNTEKVCDILQEVINIFFVFFLNYIFLSDRFAMNFVHLKHMFPNNNKIKIRI